jgi:hypothetical protein
MNINPTMPLFPQIAQLFPLVLAPGVVALARRQRPLARIDGPLLVGLCVIGAAAGFLSGFLGVGGGFIKTWKEIAIARTLAQSREIYDTYQKTRATPASRAAYSRWESALQALAEETATPLPAEEETPAEGAPPSIER